ncbi:MAG TPA: DUF2723 domain-containing protein [Bacteroidales bacterium]|nr:DUF2723 domain-containing protein [Bacteroidales bacterium]
MKFKIKPDRLFEIGVFTFSLVLYFITLSRTVNFWDCGELIACADGLQTGHPPGAPFYLLLGRLFSMFAFNPHNTALAVNLLSAVASAFAVLFTYKSIHILSQNIINSAKSDTWFYNDTQKKYLSRFAALTGSLSLAFSITFWASAIEAEVYSVSVFFTTLSIWIMLKFTQVDKSDKIRWLILAALIMGISTGVHFLNILIIPAMVFIYYFDKYKFTYKSFFTSLAISILLLGFVQLCISGLPVLASVVEWFFVNDLGAAYNTGLFVFAAALILLITAGIYISGIKKKIALNLIFTCFAVFITGYSTYTIVLIRSASNIPLDQNNPETIFNFISYLNREQYGNRPLWYGQQYNSKYDKRQPYVAGDPVYDTINGKYSIISNKPEANFEKRDKRILPRMWSNQPEHVAAYKEWSNYKKDLVPSFGANIRFMFKYQFSHMYIRYFMWNFAGRQNDFQSHGGAINGNWMSGIGIIDKLNLSQIKELPPHLKNNKARNVYYLLPLLIGLIGIYKQYKSDKKNLFILSLIFVFTGLAIAFYLNQYPYQARERDYSYIGSFYAFSIWIGLGVIGYYDLTVRFFKNRHALKTTVFVCIIAVPFQFLIKNFDDHNKHKDDFAWHFAYNMLNSCDKDAILFVSGDNETFPLWYLQECEHIREDVRIINLSFLNTDWYIDQIQRPTQGATGIKISIPKSKYISGQRELLLLKENPYAFIEDIYYYNINEINEDYAVIFNKFSELLKKSGLDKTRPAEYSNFVNYYELIQPHGASPPFRDFCEIVFSLKDTAQCDAFGINYADAQDLVKLLNKFLDKQINYPIPLNQTLNFVFSNDTATRISTKLYDYPIDYFPARKIMLPINKNEVIKAFGQVQLQEDIIVDNMIWAINKESLTKSDLMVLEIIRANMWNKPICFSSMMNTGNYLGLEQYLYLQGLVYRLIPVETEISVADPVNVNSYTMYVNFTRNFKWGNLRESDIYYDENTRNSLINLRNHYSRLARGLYFAGAVKQSQQMLDECIKLIPNDLIAFDYYCVGIVHGYYRINKNDEAGEIALITAENALAELEFYSKFPERKSQSLKLYQQRAMKTIEELYILANEYKHKEFIKQIENIYNRALKLYNNSLNTK